MPAHGHKNQRVNCSRSCGNISVPFPFGLEEGCSARKQILLDCSDMTSSMLQIYDLQVSYINIDEGIMGTKSMSPPYIIYDSLYSGSTAVANLSCQEAQQNVTSYSCVSSNSTCLGLNSTINYDGYYPYLGYICQCMTGFHGNPYVPNGCQDVDECKTTPGICKGVCHNTIGGFYCTDCPHKTEYDTTKMQCTPAKKQRSLMLVLSSKQIVRDILFMTGIMIGLGIGFGVPILGLCAVFVVQRWGRDVQKKQRRKYFWENKEIVAPQIREEANEEEISRVATLAEMCLKLKGDERPSMKQVEMTLHTLQNKRSTSCVIAPEYYQDVHPLLYPKAQTITAQSSAADIGHNSEQQSQGFSSLEQEFLASA
ncbi:hypothetical protein EJB05_40572, partial [Eragrostis curvula]